MTSRPNIIFIITDQQRFDTIAALGADHMITPNLDRLAARGTVFENMYITSPSCAPSRASLFSGTYPHTNGVFRNDEPWQYCWVKDLAEANYRTVNIGKMHTMPIEGAFGFHERHVTENKDRDHSNLPFYLDNWDKAYFLAGLEKPSRVTQRRKDDYGEKLGAWVWEHDEKMHPDVFTGQMAKWWLERYSGDGPYFLQIGLPGPHPPYDPTEEYLKMYDGRDLPEVIPADPEAQPEALQGLRDFMLQEDADGVVHLANPTPEQIRRQRAHYYANVTMIDTQVGEILDALEARGDLDNSIIIFTSDHGDALGDHGHSQKWNMYQSTMQVPAIVAGVGIPEGRRITDNVALFDLGPTILEWASVPVPAWMEAESLCPYFKDTTAPKRTKVFAEHSNDALLTGTRLMTMLIDEKMKIVHFIDSDEGQLFDLASDPYELTNLWDDAAYKETRSRMIDDILKWRSESGLKTQGFVPACVHGAHAMMSPPLHQARGQHKEGSR
ncbi:sulfatase-like hydrolase/transferase [Alphaproteobacteria bacterium]|nr:sulfatase-like hydrolase/transferase [Alphaproteobacteria bacterium]